MRGVFTFLVAVVFSFVLGVFVEHNFKVISHVQANCCSQFELPANNGKCPCPKCGCCDGCPGKGVNGKCDCDACVGRTQKKVSELRQTLQENPTFTVFAVDRDVINTLIAKQGSGQRVEDRHPEFGMFGEHP